MVQDDSTNHRSPIWIWACVSGLCLFGLCATYILFVEAPPPRRIVIATGGKDGAYYRFAERYAEQLKREGISLVVKATQGSAENLKLLADEHSDVNVAFVQTGIADPEKSGSLMALASLYREPLWIFYRGDEPIDKLTQLRGKRIAVGTEGSGTHGIAMQLLSANGIESDQAELLEKSGTAAADALENNELDVAFFVAGIEAVYVQRLLRSNDVRLVELSQTDAYERQFRFLSKIRIHAGLLDIRRNIPSEDTEMVAPAAMLVAHESLHPALISLLLKIATKIHRSGDLLAATGEFPSSELVDLPLSDDADRFFKSGPPVLQRILPFWLASLVDRLKIMVIPLIMLMMPLVKVAPPLVRWQTRRKIYMWYSQLRKIDQLAIHGMSIDEAQQSLVNLHTLEQQIARVGVPLSYMEEYYNLRLHLNLVRTRVHAILDHSDFTSSGGLEKASEALKEIKLKEFRPKETA